MSEGNQIKEEKQTLMTSNGCVANVAIRLAPEAEMTCVPVEAIAESFGMYNAEEDR